MASTERHDQRRPVPGEDAVQVSPAGPLAGTVRVPGDKSVSHRLAMLCGLAAGESTVHNFLAGQDCLDTLGSVRALGATTRRDGSTVTIQGTGGQFREPAGPLDLGNSGTGMRLLAGLLAAHPFCSELTGDASLSLRPMSRIQVPLRKMGAVVEALGADGRPPLRISGGALHGIEYEMPVASAQVKSCVLLAGLFAAGRSVVVEPGPSRDHTERLLRAMGVDLAIDGPRISLNGSGGEPLALPAGEWTVPGDFSAAAFWMVAAACRPGSEVTLSNVGLNPRRAALIDVLREMGADIERRESGVGSQGSECPDSDLQPRTSDLWEPRGDVIVRGGRLKGIAVGGDLIPGLIDELPILAAAGALADGETEIRDAAELRVKESDRIAAMAAGLAALGMDVEERPDGMRVRGGRPIRGGGIVESRGDHRVAMALAVLGTFAGAPLTVRDVACVQTSYPAFWGDLAHLTGESA